MLILPLPLPLQSSLTGGVTDASVVLGDDGIYTATAVDLFGSVASTGDLVSTVVVTDADGAIRGSAELELTNAHLDEDGSGMATLDVPTRYHPSSQVRRYLDCGGGCI